MVSTSKILTVSYGTFSCTLEGFDDSFETMKAIAEYFRDLASDDRYFGAEPPIPDAEMLARIAEREISRRVEARQEQGNIVLRAAEGTQSEAPPQRVPTTLAPAAAAAVTTPQVDAAAAELNDDLPEAMSDHNLENDLDEAEAEAEEDLVEVTAHQAYGAENVIEEIEDEDDFVDDAAAAPARSYTPVPHPDQTSVAAKLERIRAVVSKSAGTSESPAAYSEDEHAEDVLESAIHALDDVEDDAVDIHPAEIAAQADAEDATDDDDLDAILDRLIEKSERTPRAVSRALDNDDDAADDSDDQLIEVVEEAAPPIQARVIKMKRADFEAAIADGLIEEEDEDDEDEAAFYSEFDDDEDEGDEEVADTSLSPEEEAELQRELAAVEADLSLDADDDFDNEEADEAYSDLDVEDEDEDEDEEYVSSLFTEDGIAGHSDSRERLDSAGGDSDLTRLMAKTISEMDDPDSANRRNAIAHLRAAVAATKAEKQAGGMLRADDNADAYKNDLASVVRPRRPSADSGPTTRRPGEMRPAPLKLVAEQRVDGGAAKPLTPVRPRRVSMADLADEIVDETAMHDAHHDEGSAETAMHAPLSEAQAAAGNFVDFAEDMGATTLPEIIEAAAAYLSFVEGRDQFSRPQLMTKARQIEGTEFSREDGLRSFGQLLRQGKIEKLKGGRFAVSERIGYRPDTRQAG